MESDLPKVVVGGGLIKSYQKKYRMLSLLDSRWVMS